MDGCEVAPRSAAAELAGLLESPEIADLIRELDATRWTGRPGYPIRSLIGMALAKSLYAIPTWTRTVRLVREHAALRASIGPAVPSEWACYRLTRKLREHSDTLTACLDRVTAALHAKHPDMGRDVAIDGSDLPAYANGPAVPLQERAGARAILRPGCLLGAPFRRLDTQGRRVLRL